MGIDWKLKLRYGKTKTPYKHFTVLADGVVGNLADGFECEPGKAWMAMKTWSNSADESAEMIRYVADQIGFKCTGKIEIHETQPVEQPRDEPFGYGINFISYDSK